MKKVIAEKIVVMNNLCDGISRRKDMVHGHGAGGESTNERPGSDHVTSGLKKNCMGRGQTDRYIN